MNSSTSIHPAPRAAAGPTYWAALLTIVGACLFVRYLHFALTIGSDDQVWITAAREIAQSAQRTDAPVYYTRLIWTWLLIAWGWLGGLTLEWSAVLMFSLSGLTTIMIAEAARRAFDLRTGLLSAIVYGFHPLAIVYDTNTLPDVPAVLLLTAGMVLFVDFLRSGSQLRLLFLGLLIGLLFGVKNYFVLFAAPCALTILLQQNSLPVKVKSVVLLATAVMSGMLLTLLVGWFSGVEASSHAVSVEQYTSYIAADVYSPEGYQGWKHPAAQLLDRTKYIFYLFVSFGTVMGFVTLYGITLFLLRWRKAPIYTFVGTTFAVFFLFLTFLPVRLSPILFTQVQPRYLTVVLPALAIAAGAALSEIWGSLNDRALRNAAFLVMASVIALCAYVPSDLQDRFQLLEFRGLDRVLTEAPSRNIQTIALPTAYRRLIPDSFHARGVSFEFLDYGSPDNIDDLIARIESDHGLAAVVFRAPYRELKEKLRAGDVDERAVYGVAKELMGAARANDLDVSTVRVPYDTLRVWLARSGLETRGQLVGWVISRNSDAKSNP